LWYVARLFLAPESQIHNPNGKKISIDEVKLPRTQVNSKQNRWPSAQFIGSATNIYLDRNNALAT
jgi:hypothetical protein